MYKLDNRLVRKDGKSLGEIAGYFVLCLIFGFILASIPFLFFEQEHLSNITEYPELRMSFMVAQGLSNFLLFGGASLFLLFVFLKKDLSWLNREQQPFKWMDVVFTIVLFFGGYAFFEYLIEWNKNINFPPEIASWAKAMEDSAAKATEFILNFSNGFEMLIGVVVIGAVVAIGEELLFRGIIQNLLFAWTKNIHVAILLTGIIFSAIHFQFYGFVPRVVISLLLSYIYFISGNIWLSIFLHFTNNALSVVASYFMKDVEEEALMPSMHSALLSFFFLTIVLIYFYRQNKAYYVSTTKDE